MGSNKTLCEPLGDLDLRITRRVEAPRELVWKAHATPESLQLWWGPKGFSHVDQAFDFQAGGAWSFGFIAPDGTVFQERIAFTELKEPELIAMDHGDGTTVLFRVRTRLEEAGAGTVITTTMAFKDKAARDATLVHVEPGHASSMERLDVALKELVGRSAEGTEGRELRGTRFLPVPRRRVFQAWRDPGQLRLWWGPKGFSNEFHEFEFRPGGVWRFGMIGPNGELYPNHSVFHEIVADELVRLEHKAPHFFITARFSDELDGCRLDWRMVFDSKAACDQVRSFAKPGLFENLDRLAALLKAEP